MKAARSNSPFLLCAIALAAASCSWVERMPKVSLPSFVKGGESSKPEDPLVPFDARRDLAYGHTLKLAVYRNTLHPSRVFRGDLMVDEKGLVHLGAAGDVKVGGRSAFHAAKGIEAAFRRQLGDTTITVQLESIEGVPLVTIDGSVRAPAVIPWTEGLTAEDALPRVRGRTGSADATSLHLMRKGERHFRATPAGVALEPGDVVTFSGSL